LGRLIACAVLAALVLLRCATPPPPPVLAQTEKTQTATAQTAKSAAPAPNCASCHVGDATSYLHAPMRHAMEVPGADPVLDTHPTLTVQQGGYTYTILTVSRMEKTR
jgi:hypothetical protein